ncbi:MAG: hypothetical protein KatS3mg034_0412 [Vicingaceae bacterium]|nr:MAG: hypothetical protein KatS3mg034_0412 [Vicingaceae bacterium]
MKKISKIFVLLIIWVTSIKSTKACSPIDAPVLVSQNVSGNQLILQWASITGWACSYNVVVDIQCASGGPNLLTRCRDVLINPMQDMSNILPHILSILVHYVRAKLIDSVPVSVLVVQRHIVVQVRDSSLLLSEEI